jgi:C4-dicarboxylate-specific signal transduction histidine kinase
MATGEAMWVVFDPSELRFILDNLVGNAIEAMRGSERRELVLFLERVNARVRLEVRDTGCGIPPEAQERLFDAVHTRLGAGGFGLPRSAEIVRRWGGEIRLEESGPEGTTFSLSLVLSDRGTSTATT